MLFHIRLTGLDRPERVFAKWDGASLEFDRYGRVWARVLAQKPQTLQVTAEGYQPYRETRDCTKMAGWNRNAISDQDWRIYLIKAR
jgi:hypothetical protein